ncbi:hypothetical protein AB0H76_09465 [Nocardia sp. NPDC050712]|uniref:hypothetical protein n=1 Tax=Nocardia sp. NPDC050712 TaxID=3155518 RepID=UPI0033D7F1A0
MTTTRTSRMNVLLPQAIAADVLDIVIGMHVSSALALTGEQAACIDRGPGHLDSPGVMRWEVTYTTGSEPLPLAGLAANSEACA